eukprot:s16_g17.t1
MNCPLPPAVSPFSRAFLGNPQRRKNGNLSRNFKEDTIEQRKTTGPKDVIFRVTLLTIEPETPNGEDFVFRCDASTDSCKIPIDFKNDDFCPALRTDRELAVEDLELAVEARQCPLRSGAGLEAAEDCPGCEDEITTRWTCETCGTINVPGTDPDEGCPERCEDSKPCKYGDDTVRDSPGFKFDKGDGDGDFEVDLRRQDHIHFDVRFLIEVLDRDRSVHLTFSLGGAAGHIDLDFRPRDKPYKEDAGRIFENGRACEYDAALKWQEVSVEIRKWFCAGTG